MLPYRKNMYTFQEWNDLVKSGAITKDFDYTMPGHVTQTHHRSPDCHNLAIKTVLIPIECPDCKAKLWDVSLSANCSLPNMLVYFRINKQVVICEVCHFSDLRLKAGELPK